MYKVVLSDEIIAEFADLEDARHFLEEKRVNLTNTKFDREFEIYVKEHHIDSDSSKMDEIMLHFYEMTGKRIQGQCRMEHNT